jgi:hypothetical protein
MTVQTQLIRVPLDAAGREDTGQIVVEVDSASSGIVRAARPGEIVTTASRTLAESFDQVRETAESLLRRLAALPSRPDTVELELGVKINAEAGAIIARTAAEGNFLLRLTWQNPGGRGAAPEAPAEAPAD